MTRMEEAALARGIFEKAQQYKAKWDAYNKAVAANDKTAKEPDHDLGLDPVVQVLEGKRIVHNHTHRADDVMTVIRLADEFHYRLVVHHGTESCDVADELAKRHIAVSFTIIDSPGGKPETINFSISCPARLEKAGVKVAFNTDDPITNSRLLLRSAALAVRGGMSEEAALKGLTIYPAEMLDLQNRVGSLEPGKDADFIVLSGAPLSVYTHVLETWIEGEKVFDRSNPLDLRYATGGFQVSADIRNRLEARNESANLSLADDALAFTSTLRAQNLPWSPTISTPWTRARRAGPDGADPRRQDRGCTAGCERAAARGISGDPWRLCHPGANRRRHHHRNLRRLQYSRRSGPGRGDRPEHGGRECTRQPESRRSALPICEYYGVTTVQITPGPRIRSPGAPVSSRPQGHSLPSARWIN